MLRLNTFWHWAFPEGKSRIHTLDVLRATAIMAVILYHFPKDENQKIFRGLSHFGNLGVDLFFVLSGYLIGGQLFKTIKSSQNFSIKTFYLKRFLRTLPSYYLILVLNAFLIGFKYFDWRYLIFAQNFGGLYQFTHSWSLCIEEHFYLFFPLIVYLLHSRNKIHYFPVFAIGVFVTSLIWRLGHWVAFRPDLIYSKDINQSYEYYFKYIFYPTIGRLDGIALGTLIAYIKIFNKDAWGKLLCKSNHILLLALVLLGALMPLVYFKVGWFNVFFGFPLITLSFGLILISAAGDNSILRNIRLPGVTTISLLSYSLYLTHGWAIDSVQKIFQKNTLSTTSSIAYISMLMMSLVFSFILYLLIERPFLQLRNKIITKKS